ncbi:hypothetical protein DNHGIG_07700 [Collibacillus ludicampi]|uniref:Uncharacterized protein n=1 Tax=Collibacillus ludicampi TaxID=2771369 RepID=A0AAV4LBY5_9BACL|nr:hypothetical protein [Collibacillus ludicampi]GIM45221.1 hypothetical protein DNHGIG_07700 [Collibacillus ludicampi]
MTPTIYISGAVLMEGSKDYGSGTLPPVQKAAIDMTQYIADSIVRSICEVSTKLGIWLIHVSPDIMLIFCMGSILGMMIGSERCRRWAGFSALATMILSVVSKAV